MNYKEKYEEFKSKIEQNIANLIPEKSPKNLYESFKYIMNCGGKRIRPVLAMISAGAVGGNPEAAMNAATAIEILHNFTLVHDDIMDNSNLRRGRETVHIKWNEEVAIISGDMMTGWAFRFLSKKFNENISEKQIAKLNETLATALIEVCEGQEFDMEFNERNNVSESEYLEMIKLKTSSLICCAVKLGGIVGDCTENELFSLNNYAENLGIAFQIQDDILDFSAEQEKFGKKIGQDIIEGKKTFPILKAAKLATKAEHKELIDKYFNSKNGLDESFVEKFNEMFVKLNIFEICQNEIDKYFKLAENSLLDLKENDYKKMLIWIISMLNKRIF
jgi:geranylgeranyl pyrophosphate synthase